MVVGLTAFQ